jgi:hypothetical protein
MAKFTSVDQQGEFSGEPQRTRSFYSEEHATFPYSECEFVVEDFYESGYKQAQVARRGAADDLGGECKVVRVGDGIARRTVSFNGVRDAEWPTVPAPKVLSKDGFLHSYRILRGYKPLGDGTAKQYVIRGEYHYLLKLPTDPSQGLPLVGIPVLTDEGNEDEVPGSAFDQDAIP